MLSSFTTPFTFCEASVPSTATSPAIARSIAARGGVSASLPENMPAVATTCRVTGSKITASVRPRSAVCSASTAPKVFGSPPTMLPARARSLAIASASARMLLRCSSR